MRFVGRGVAAAFDIGTYWNARTQIDVVGVRADGWTDLGECKWGTVRSLRAVERELAAKVERFPNPRNATIRRRLFLRARPARARSEHARAHARGPLRRRRRL